MKNKITLSFVSILLLLFVFLINVSATTIITPDTGGNIYFDYDSDDTTSYYQSLNGLNGEEFKTELHEIISSGNIAKYSYNDVKTLLMQLDEDPNNENNILCLLTGKSMPKSSFGGTGREAWNREHIWPKSHGFNNESLSPYTDLNHLRAAEAYTNSTYHNDYDYGELLEGYTEDKYGNKYVSNLGDGQGVYEPRDAIKGDIARMIMYMDVRYEGDQLSSDIQLEISNDHTAPSSMTGQIGMLDTLIKWHQQDPVDDLERVRNERAYGYQGNRNPFIDYPEFAELIWG